MSDEQNLQRIAAMERELATAHAELQDFTRTVSHDLRAPLRHIVSFAQLLRDEAGVHLDAEQLGFLTTISDSARHMGVLLDGLLALSRVGSADIAPVAVPLQSMVHEICAELSHRHPQRELEWQIAQDLPTVLADATLLRQALVHVLGNAVKFTVPCQTAHISVASQPDARGGWVVLQVQDNGVGFNPQAQGRLFQVFGRLHGPKEFEGIGIGLVTVRKIIERHGGTVSAQALPAGGSSFCITLPLA